MKSKRKKIIKNTSQKNNLFIASIVMFLSFMFIYFFTNQDELFWIIYISYSIRFVYQLCDGSTQKC